MNVRGRCLIFAAFLTGLSLPALAQTPKVQGAAAGVRVLAFPEGRVSGLSGAYWTRALADGDAMPAHERLLAVASDGRVLGVVDGERDKVVLSLELVRALNEHALDATLVHNHPTNVSLGESDLHHLAKVGVTRVVAIGSEGTVYEAAAGSRYAEVFSARHLYGAVEARVRQRLAAEATRDREDLGPLAIYVPHLVAVVLDRAKAIQYLVTPGNAAAPAFDHYRHLFERVVRAEARRLEKDLGR